MLEIILECGNFILIVIVYILEFSPGKTSNILPEAFVFHYGELNPGEVNFIT